MTGNVLPYTTLITSEHQPRQKYMATVSGLLQPFADLLQLYADLPGDFDIDKAVGVQLDCVGVRVGISRQLPEPLTGVYFSFGIANVGFGQGIWFSPYDPTTELVSLPDDQYRILLKAKIAKNQWDGSYEGAMAIWSDLFGLVDAGIYIQEMSPLEVIYALTGSPDIITQAIFGAGLMDLRPATIEIRSRLVPSVPNTPYFGFWPKNVDVPESNAIGGFGQGAWGTPVLSDGLLYQPSPVPPRVTTGGGGSSSGGSGSGTGSGGSGTGSGGSGSGSGSSNNPGGFPFGIGEFGVTAF